ncbi:MAG TPA: hypothetical protein VHB21_01535 [Minicystis sp.]|nr:hypothetical protein [Minicystis sp.]
MAFGAALIAAASTANAQERGNRLPLNYIDRPLTLPAGVLEPQIEYDIVHNPGELATVPGTNTKANSAFYSHFLNIGAAVGLTPNFELQATFLPIEISPNQQYGNPEFSGTLKLTRGRSNFDLGARMGVTLNTVPLVTFQKQGANTIKTTSIKVESTTLQPGLPLVLRFHHQARIDTGIFTDFTVGHEVQTPNGNGTYTKTSGTIVGVSIPADLSIATAKNAYIGAGTGLQFDDVSQASASFSMPLKLYAGFSMGTRRHPYFDVVPYVTWDHLFTPGQSSPTTVGTANGAGNGATMKVSDAVQPTTPTTAGPQETFHWDAWQFGLQLRGYMHFM